MIIMSIIDKFVLQAEEKRELLPKINKLLGKVRLNVAQNIIWYVNKITYEGDSARISISNQYGVFEVTLTGLPESDRDKFDKILNGYLKIIEWTAQAVALTLNSNEHIIDNELVLDDINRKKFPYINYRAWNNFEAMRERYAIISQIREYLGWNDFIELETPILGPVFYEYTWNSFITKDELLDGYYSLPQSPQPYKQLSILSWVQKYFQIARCFRRDADGAYRKIEFTQIDVELATNDSRDIMNTLEWMIRHLFSLKWIQLDQDIPVFTYHEALEKFWTDKPVLKDKEYSLVRVVKAPIFELNKNGDLIPSHHIVSKPIKEDMHLLDIDPLLVRWNNYDLILNGQEVAGWDIRIDDPLLQYKMFKTIGYSDEHIEKYYMWFIEALSKGCPPHGWFATWVERVITLLNHHNDIEKYILFPKHPEWDPMTNHPIKL